MLPNHDSTVHYHKDAAQPCALFGTDLQEGAEFADRKADSRAALLTYLIRISSSRLTRTGCESHPGKNAPLAHLI